jgi:hypothetical protein
MNKNHMSSQLFSGFSGFSGFAVLLASVLFSGCATVPDSVPDEEILHVTANVYEVLDVDRRGIFGSEASLMNSVIRQAEKFASSKGKVVSPISARVHRVGILADWAWFYYKFELVDSSDPKSMRNISDIEIVRDVRLANEFYINRDKLEKSAIYNELLQLDDLRKKGILTDDEFSRRKNILISK